MSSFEKRERAKRKAERKRMKDERRWERRDRPPEEPEYVRAEDVAGGMRSVEEVMKQLEANGPHTSRDAGGGAEPIPVRLFVGGLSYDTTSESLRAAFETQGEVLDAAVVKNRDTGESRGFGFVTMADQSGARTAMRALDGQDLDGRRIKVNPATER